MSSSIDPDLRRWAFQVLNDSSIGLKSGEYGGRYRSMISTSSEEVSHKWME